jgi:hypothetical protein
VRFALTPSPGPLPHGSRPAFEAERDKFAPELSRVAAAFGPTAIEMIVVGRETTRPLRFAPQRGSAGSQPAADRFAFGPDEGRNALERRAGRFQPCGFLIARLPARISSPTALLDRRRFGGVGRGYGCTGHRHDRFFRDLLGNPANLDVLTIDDGSNGITEIAQQVPTVSDLNRVRRPLADTVGVGAGAVARDDLDTGVLAEPGGQRFRLPIRQQVHNLIALQIDQNGSVAMATTPSPIIDRKHPRRRCRALTGHGRSRHPQ